jgi:hypothetical protein
MRFNGLWINNFYCFVRGNLSDSIYFWRLFITNSTLESTLSNNSKKYFENVFDGIGIEIIFSKFMILSK